MRKGKIPPEKYNAVLMELARMKAERNRIALLDREIKEELAYRPRTWWGRLKRFLTPPCCLRGDPMTHELTVELDVTSSRMKKD